MLQQLRASERCRSPDVVNQPVLSTSCVLSPSARPWHSSRQPYKSAFSSFLSSWDLISQSIYSDLAMLSYATADVSTGRFSRERTNDVSHHIASTNSTQWAASRRSAAVPCIHVDNSDLLQTVDIIMNMLSNERKQRGMEKNIHDIRQDSWPWTWSMRRKFVTFWFILQWTPAVTLYQFKKQNIRKI